MKFFSIPMIILWSFSNHAGLKVATYNLGLAHTFVPLAKERRPHLAEALVSLPTDVLCLQEVWNEKDRKYILKALKDSHPYQYTTPIKNVKSKKQPTCSLGDIFGGGEFITYIKKATKNCRKLKDQDFLKCILITYRPILENLKQNNRECAAALMGQFGKHPLVALLTVLNPFVGAGMFIYEGSNGLMLLSKYPLSKKRLLDMAAISTLTKRGALIAQVNAQTKKYQAVCTHLSANLSTIPYMGTYSGWGEENKEQFVHLLKEIQSSTLPTILMGDFNCGLGNPQFSLDPNFEDSCRLISTTNFSDHFAENNPECTSCSETSNSLNAGKITNTLIDHIYLRGVSAASSQVIFKEKVTVESKTGKLLTNLSDHFGILVELE